MGRRKSRKKPPAKLKDVGLPSIFDCPFCVHTGAVEWTRREEKQKFVVVFVTQIGRPPTSQPCDVFNDWIDSCEAENRGEAYGDDQYEEEIQDYGAYDQQEEEEEEEEEDDDL